MSQVQRVISYLTLPSQNFFKEDTIEFIVDCIINKREERLPPNPVVRCAPAHRKYAVIDGHNLIAVYDMLNRPFNVHVAESSRDYANCNAQEIDAAARKRKSELELKFDTSLRDVIKTREAGIKSFTELRKKYHYMQNLQTAAEYFRIR